MRWSRTPGPAAALRRVARPLPSAGTGGARPETDQPRGAQPIANLHFRTAESSDLPQIARVAMAAFPEPVRHYLRGTPTPLLAADIFAICLEAEPEGLLVADDGGRIAGYLFAARWPGRVFRRGMLRGAVWRMVLRGLAGRYGISWSESFAGVRAYLGMWHEAQAGTLPGEGRIFSVAVHPDYRRRGIGTELVRLALRYLEDRGATAARLEVRAGNTVAQRLYERLGFRAEGGLTDSMGWWTIMRKSLVLPKDEAP